MRVRIVCAMLAALPLGALHGQTDPPAPLIDYHQHLFSPDAAELVSPKPAPGDSAALAVIRHGIPAKDVIALLDSAGIRRALVLSVAYTWGAANRTVENEYEHVKAENDWT